MPLADHVPDVGDHFTLYPHRQAADLPVGRGALPEPASAAAGELVAQLRRLLTESAATIGYGAYLLETSAAEVDDAARVQICDDASVVDEELATVKALLAAPVDWDAEARRLFDGEIPPLPPEGDSEQDELAG